MNSVVIMIIVEIFLITFAIFSISFIIKNLKSYEYEKKFSEFSLLSIADEEESFFEKLSSILFNLVYKISKFLSLSKIIAKHSAKFDSYYKINSRIKNSIDYISLKILCALIFVFCSSIILIIRNYSINFIELLISLIIGYFIPNIFITYKQIKRKKMIEDDLLKAIIIMNNAFASGRNIIQAIKAVEKELSGSISDEFRKISLDISYGLSLEVVFDRFYERVKIEDAKYIALTLTLLDKTGGNIVSVFSMIEKSFFEKKKLKDELNSLTASSIFMFRFLVILPPVFAIIISILNNEYFKPLISSLLGMFILLIILSLYTLYIIVIKTVLKVKI